ncbi:hypothetical protein BN000_03291 [Neobacillus massiliamazoniensis]|uniref:Uncharacterized protein n=1 Tax=Neobacillus massiliamazoniensis TaxID=1499688 RepID=A0A0U1NZA7_9BACI|nr:hypothetical protein BN000_03291 [Neobacillus massiliamazoniensis]
MMSKRLRRYLRISVISSKVIKQSGFSLRWDSSEIPSFCRLVEEGICLIGMGLLLNPIQGMKLSFLSFLKMTFTSQQNSK